ncbi:hypothetical protein HYH03_009608 [Edaphochlamys debaryana]|uniref:Uncharacterized protein n=1 Tax=Edaphochlamys debaryana TaxID=47281 RepID=A0A836BXL8_9CHLO|nr:hypothetical protein HYH03_009608 [Edaphochlamys debaryana]|eukprot:KAG2492117.1 hypothetical protein HYH03_009608 [Edaphochlamys debaryana]
MEANTGPAGSYAGSAADYTAGGGGDRAYGGGGYSGSGAAAGYGSPYGAGGGDRGAAGYGYGTAGAGGGGGRYSRTSPRRPLVGPYPRLVYLQWLWGAIAWFWGSLGWALTLPWRITTWLTPSFLRPAVDWVEDTALWWLGPPIRLAANLTHGTIAAVDRLLSGGRTTVSSTHTGNTHHFWVALEAYLRLIQHKAHLVEKHGFDGLWMALTTKTV